MSDEDLCKFQPDQDITFRFMFQTQEILFCQIKIRIDQNAPSQLILVRQHGQWYH